MNKVVWDMENIGECLIEAERIGKESGILKGYDDDIFYDIENFKGVDMYEAIRMMIEDRCLNIILSYLNCPSDDAKCHAPACWSACGEIARWIDTDEEFFDYDCASCVKKSVDFCRMMRYCVEDGLGVLYNVVDIYRGLED